MIELRRQAVHVAFGLAVAFLGMVLTQQQLIVALAVGLIAQAAFLSVPSALRAAVMDSMERKRNRHRFPGKGALAITVGALLTAVVFPAGYVPALLIVALADAASTLGGVYLGKRATPWSPNKTWMGVGAFFIVSAAILVFWTPWWPLAALVLTAVEAVDYRDVAFLDDNLLLPLATGALLILI